MKKCMSRKTYSMLACLFSLALLVVTVVEVLSLKIACVSPLEHEDSNIWTVAKDFLIEKRQQNEEEGVLTIYGDSDSDFLTGWNGSDFYSFAKNIWKSDKDFDNVTKLASSLSSLGAITSDDYNKVIIWSYVNLFGRVIVEIFIIATVVVIFYALFAILKDIIKVTKGKYEDVEGNVGLALGGMLMAYLSIIVARLLVIMPLNKAYSYIPEVNPSWKFIITKGAHPGLLFVILVIAFAILFWILEHFVPDPVKEEAPVKDAISDTTAEIGDNELSSNDARIAEKKYCTKCGKQLDVNMEFCPNCGAKATVDAESEADNKATENSDDVINKEK